MSVNHNKKLKNCHVHDRTACIAQIKGCETYETASRRHFFPTAQSINLQTQLMYVSKFAPCATFREKTFAFDSQRTVRNTKALHQNRDSKDGVSNSATFRTANSSATIKLPPVLDSLPAPHCSIQFNEQLVFNLNIMHILVATLSPTLSSNTVQ